MRMNKRWLLFTLALLVVALSSFVLAQEQVLTLNPYDGTPGSFINAQIAADTLPGGIIPANRVYELQRNAPYLANATFRVNAGQVLRLRAASGAGKPPVIMLYPTGTGANPQNPPGNFIDLRGDLWMDGIILTGYFEPIDTNIYNLQGGLINVPTAGSGANIYINNCIIKSSNGNHIRTDGDVGVCKVTNSIFADMGYLGRSNLGAGKGVDFRAAKVDSAIFINNTWINWQDRVIRHYNFGNPLAGTSPINNFVFDHNTLANGMSYHGMFNLGSMGKKATITNNLFIDPFSLGNDTDATRQAEFLNSGEYDPFGGPRMNWIFSAPNDSTEWVISNNYYVISDSGQAFYNEYAAAGVTGEGSPLTWHINSKLGADSVKAFKKVNLGLAKIPMLMTKMNRWYRSPSGGNKTKNTPNAAIWNSSYDYDRKGWQYYNDTLNCNIQATATTLAKLVSSDGKVVGDPRWGAPTVVADPNALIVVDGEKDAFYNTLTGPSDGYLQLKSSAYNDNGMPKNDDDLSAKIWTAWDNDWLYLYAEVKDDTIKASATNVWEQDEIEIKIDPKATDSTQQVPGSGSPSIWDTRLTVLQAGDAGIVTVDSMNNVPATLKQRARKINSDSYALELAIHWSTIKSSNNEMVDVAVDSVFGMAINIHDNDVNRRQASVTWAAVMLDAVWNTPKYLGTVKFKSGNKLEFIAKNNMTGRENTTVKYDGTDPSLSVSIAQPGIPTEYAISQNYPNPFNPATTIKYQLPVSGMVTLKVYNFIGQEVATLVNEHQDAAYYTLKFNASKLASGVYFYTLRSGSYVETKKMLLIK